MYRVKSEAHLVKISSIVLLRNRDWWGGAGPAVEAPIVDWPRVDALKPPGAPIEADGAELVVPSVVGGFVVVADPGLNKLLAGADVVAALVVVVAVVEGVESGLAALVGPRKENAGAAVVLLVWEGVVDGCELASVGNERPVGLACSAA